MGMAQLVVASVLVEGRSKSEVARTYGVSRQNRTATNDPLLLSASDRPEPTVAEVRAWARRAGLDVPDRAADFAPNSGAPGAPPTDRLPRNTRSPSSPLTVSLRILQSREIPRDLRFCAA